MGAFEMLQPVPDDPLLGVMAAYRADPDRDKIDLGVGVYRNAHGETPVLKAVRIAEERLYREQTTKAYVGPGGNLKFNEAMRQLVFGAVTTEEFDGRISTIQTPGGCGALRLGAELLRIANPNCRIWLSDPTWANHGPLLQGAGLQLAVYPYYDATTGAISRHDMLGSLEKASPGDAVLLQASCHNPTGVDLTHADWDALTALCLRRELTPFVDLAYLGFAESTDADALGLRLMASHLPSMLVAVSCAKNFGLYRERAGALFTLTESQRTARIVQGHLQRVARTIYSMPPDHGAEVVALILRDPTMAALWRSELAEMHAHILAVREELHGKLKEAIDDPILSRLKEHRGLFSLLPLSPSQVQHLRERHHVYLPDSGRINVAGVLPAHIPRLALAIADAMTLKLQASPRMPQT